LEEEKLFKKVNTKSKFKKLKMTLPPNAKGLQDIAIAQQRYSLQGVAKAMEREGKVSASVQVHRNKNGTVSGELRLFNIQKGYTINDLLTDLSMIMHADLDGPSEFRLPDDAGHWISVGALADWGGTKEDWQGVYENAIRRGNTEKEARILATATIGSLPRYRGKSRVSLYPQRSELLPVNIFRAQQGPLGERSTDRVTGRKFGRGNKRKPSEILLRTYWNPWDRSPANVR
jgi:hypothetical protein